MFASAEACLSSRESREQIRNPVSVNRQVSQSPTVNTQGGLHLFSITGAGSFIPAIILLMILAYTGFRVCKSCLTCQRQSMGRDARNVMRKEGDWIPSPTGSEATTPSQSPSPPPRRRKLSPDRHHSSRHSSANDRFMERPVPRTLDSENTGLTWRQLMQERRERHAREMEQSRQQVAQQLHVHFAGNQDQQPQQRHSPSPGLTQQEIRELRQVGVYWREMRAMAEPMTPRRQPSFHPPTEETSFTQQRLRTPRTETPPRPPRGIRTLVAGKYPEVTMTEAEIREKLPHSARTPPHLLPPSMSRTPALPQLRPRHQSTPGAAQGRAGGTEANDARPGEPSSVPSPIRALRPLPGSEEPRPRSSLSGTPSPHLGARRLQMSQRSSPVLSVDLSVDLNQSLDLDSLLPQLNHLQLTRSSGTDPHGPTAFETLGLRRNSQ